MMLRYLIEKEFKQLKRNSFLPRLILLFPCMMMLVMPWAATLEIENLRIAVIDNDRSPSSERLVHRIEASRYFQLTALPPSYAQGLQAIEKDQADMLLEIPRGFEKAQANGQSPADSLQSIPSTVQRADWAALTCNRYSIRLLRKILSATVSILT